MDNLRGARGNTDTYMDGNATDLEDSGLDLEVELPTELPLTPQEVEDAIIARSILRVWANEDAKYGAIAEKAVQSWDLYHMTWDGEPKDDWQSDVRYPHYLMAVERLTSVLMQLLDMTPNWFECEALIPQHQVAVDIGRRFAKFLLGHDLTNFRSILAELFRAGLITGQMALQILFEKDGIPIYSASEEGITAEDILGNFRMAPPGSKKPFIPNPDLPRVSLKVIPARCIRGDSVGMKRYQVWQQRVPVSYLFDQGKAIGFNQDACARAMQKCGKSGLGSQAARESMEKNESFSVFPEDKMVTLTFIEGDLPHYSSQNIIFKDKLAIAVEDELCFGPAETPWWDGEKAIIMAPFIPVPHSIYGKSPLVENIDPFHTQINIINLMIDYCQQVVYGTWEVDKDKLDEESQRFNLKIYPGQVFITENNPSGSPCVRRVPPPEPQAGFFNFFEIFRTTLDQTTGMANIGGAARARGRMTGMEAQSKAAESGSTFKTMFEEIERRLLAPTVRLVYLRGLQFCTDAMWTAWVKIESQSILDPATKDPALLAEWTAYLNDMSTWDAQTRFKKLGSFFRFNVKIFSSVADRQMEVEKAGFIIQQMGKIPQAMEHLRMDVIMRNLARALSWDPDKVLRLDVLPKPGDKMNNETGFSEFQEVGGGSPEISVPDITGGVYDMFNPVEGNQPTQAQLNMAPTPNSPRSPMPSMVNPVAGLPGQGG